MITTMLLITMHHNHNNDNNYNDNNDAMITILLLLLLILNNNTTTTNNNNNNNAAHDVNDNENNNANGNNDHNGNGNASDDMIVWLAALATGHGALSDAASPELTRVHRQSLNSRERHQHPSSSVNISVCRGKRPSMSINIRQCPSTSINVDVLHTPSLPIAAPPLSHHLLKTYFSLCIALLSSLHTLPLLIPLASPHHLLESCLSVCATMF